MPCRNPCGLYIHLAFTYSVGPSNVVWSVIGPAPPFPPNKSGLSYQGHTGAPAGPAAKNGQPWKPGGAPGALFSRSFIAGMAGGGGWGCHQPPVTLPGWGLGAAPLFSIKLPRPVIGEFFGHNLEILVFASLTGYGLISPGFLSLNWGIFYKFL